MYCNENGNFNTRRRILYLEINNESCNQNSDTLYKIPYHVDECGLDIDVFSVFVLDLYERFRLAVVTINGPIGRVGRTLLNG